MKKKIKIAVLIDAWLPYRGGAQVHVENLMRLISGQADFTLYHAPSVHPFVRTLWMFFVILQVLIENKKKKYNLIHAHAYLAGFPGKILSILLNIPVIYTVHGSNTLDLHELQKSNKNISFLIWKYYLEKFLLTQLKYSKQISVSRHFLYYKNKNQKISVIPNGVDVDEFDKLKNQKRKIFTIIFVGRKDKVKGFKYLNRSMSSLKKKKINFALVKFTGENRDRNQLIKAYKSSNLFVSSSVSEGQPLTLLEAWAAKLPVVVTTVGDNPKMVKDGINGYLVPPANSKTLTKAILKAIHNPQLEQLGKSGYNLVKKSYSWEIASQKTLKVYKEVLNGTR